ncbi:4-hydroxyphenylacetate 3-hydroxylase N-terminal domain-containing protein [Variovorax ginsengisoli]|uniref:4-hydroxyphenylacetate 3-hydroxylase N-terminal domain-containing protein n=1 Tax=Variovorax ginsengisoli TaxID=363844 RepID=A0ABT8SCL6_9BURK|nr:4-hydroxyphenylacetate 3-hydroxylase N-terminal domain-containing protein [Variovorax ginsengisoli]MDN8617320.1 4-hydroxyphenylacetate 3-hydroxylase N-terminal domain-containing protein [Variovorax ginsengisoli]MDO1536490.1 4-hydroxyphenylacetate 3-hydroxylase N-terminal domain-containing protein [Variovorax ginsengisoli]
MIRTGEQYLDEISDGRIVWLGSEKIISVATTPAFLQGARAFAALYDQASAAAHRQLFYAMPGDGGEAHEPEFRAFLPCKDSRDLALKHKLHASWSEASFGFLGRTPDYIAAAMSGFVTTPEAFRGDTFDGRSNLQSLHLRAKTMNLFVAFTLTNIKRDRSKPLSEQDKVEPDIGIHAVRESDAGIFVSGVKAIGTAAIYSDEIIVGSIEPLHPSDVAYALTFCIPPAAPGVSLISRASYSASAGAEDAPLSSALDENDAILVMKDVFVPWDHVLTYRDTRSTFGIWWNTPAYASMGHQASIRFYKKLEFLTGLAYLVLRSSGSLTIPEVRGSLGRLVGYAQLARSIAMGAELEYESDPEGTGHIAPNRRATYAQRLFASEVYPKFIHELRMFCGGSLIYLPANLSDFNAPEIGEILKSYFGTPEVEPVDRARLLKLVWDVTSTEFGSRHAHYEQFYQGAPHVYLWQLAEQGRLEELGRIATNALSKN